MRSTYSVINNEVVETTNRVGWYSYETIAISVGNPRGIKMENKVGDKITAEDFGLDEKENEKCYYFKDPVMMCAI
jgi:hypothetical protein